MLRKYNVQHSADVFGYIGEVDANHMNRYSILCLCVYLKVFEGERERKLFQKVVSRHTNHYYE